jgi:Fic-DOC domain mobile mystery protein B
VTDPLLPVGDGHTELGEEDRLGLIPTYIATRADLYDAEQRNIAAVLLRRRPGLSALLDDKYLRDLHKTMFGDVWSWAGRYRTRETNIGVAPAEIATAVRSVVDDVKVWVEHRTFAADELAARFHHRLVAMHPFPNGNGRHGRVTADYLVERLGQPAFSWGSELEVTTPVLRDRYQRALQAADGGDIGPLVSFVRS